jgi:hypothetical protein
MTRKNDLDATLAELDKSIAKPVYSSEMDNRVKVKSAGAKELSKLAERIKVIIENNQDAKPQLRT